VPGQESPEFEAGPSVSRWRARLPARFVVGAASTFFALLLGAEIASRAALDSGFLYREFDFSGVLLDRPELRGRIAWAAARPRPVLLLGDSVLGAGALSEHGVEHSRRQTVPALVGPLLARDGWSVESLGADGLLVPDLLALCRELQGPAPRRLVVVLNVRMFAEEFEKSSDAVSRDFLVPDVAETVSLPPEASGWSSLDRRAARWTEEHVALLRTTRLLQTLWYFPTRRDFYRRLIEGVSGGPEDADIREAALRLKVAPYYQNAWSERTIAFRAVAELLHSVRSLERTVIVLSPQNPDFIGDRDLFESNRRLLRDFVGARADSRSTEYRDLADLFPPDRFLDHCHLTAAGNRDYAQTLAALIRS